MRLDPARFAGVLALAVVMGLGARHYLAPGLAVPGIGPVVSETATPTQKRFSMCARGPRRDCVVDGDTFYFGSEKVRIADIDTPETFSPQCASEKALGKRATRRLHALLNAGPVALRSTGRSHDIYGRRLAIVQRDGRSLGATLVAEGLARRWDGARRSWCG